MIQRHRYVNSEDFSRSHGMAISIQAICLCLLMVGTGAARAQTQNTTTNYAYDAQGNLTTITNPNGQVTIQAFDALNRKVQVTQSVPAAGGTAPVIATSYDGRDQIVSVTDPRNLTTSYQVDGLGNLLTLTSPDAGATIKTYDVAGNLLTSKDARGKTTTFTYDVLNRVTSISYPTGTATTLQYDGGSAPLANDIGHLTLIADESGSTRYQYDGYGHVVQKTQVSGSGANALSQVVQYVYGTSGATNGKLTSTVYPTGMSVGYTYDSAGRVAIMTVTPSGGTATNLLTAITYTAFGAPNGWTWGNGTPYTRTFDLDGRLTSYPLGATSGTLPTPNALTRTIDYDPASRINAYAHADATGNNASPIAISANQNFYYDNLDRLTNFYPAGVDQGFTYDNTGNRTSLMVGTTLFTNAISASSNQLTGNNGPIAPKTNLYDAAGNLISDGTVTYGYSDRGRMASATVGSNSYGYLYNGLGQRVVKTGPTAQIVTGSIRYAYDEAGHLLGEYDGSGNPIQQTIYLGDTPVVVLRAQ